MESESLKASSRRWMGAALAAFAKGPTEHDFAVHHAAVAVEHLMKAYLASLHPVLIVDANGNGGLDSLLHATGHGRLAQGTAAQVKTIGILKARQYVQRLLPEKFHVSEDDLKPLSDARNGVAHAATYEADGAQGVLAVAMRIIDPLLDELGCDPDEYWSPYRELHDQLVDRRVKAVRIRLATKIARARDVFAQRFGHLNEDERADAILRAIAQTGPRLERPACGACPACPAQGWVAGDTTIGKADGKDAVLFIPALYACSVCGLELWGEEFRELGDLATPILLDDDPSDYLYDEDSDTIRHR